MTLETWLNKVKKTISHSFDHSVHVAPPTKKPLVIKRQKVGVLAFEIARIMPKLTHLWRFLSDENITRLRNQSICLEGVRKIVSNKDAFLLGLARAEMVEGLRVVAVSVSRLSKKCEDTSLKGFDTMLDVFANTGHDPYSWVLTLKDMEVKIKKMERYVMDTTTLYKEMDELTIIENKIKKLLNSCKNKKDHEEVINTTKEQQKILDLQQKLILQKQQVKYVKEKSLWNRSFDAITSLLASSIFTILSRIKIVFGINHQSWNVELKQPLIKSHQENNEITHGFFETNSKILKPSSSTLGYAALYLHYANLIIVMEKMIRSPQLVGLDARDDLYSMLPNSIRSSLRCRLKGIGFIASDPVLASEWREALGKILGWLSPLAHNMIKWQNERSFEHQNQLPKTNVLLLQTLYFANQDKTEAAITELLVGLNYIWRFEREMNAKALFNCTHNFNSNKDSDHTS
ncbi:protein PSK SIMULATOR 1-like [Rutidosis leptorrhynchoides]|uniref:protein PSK SIMULATOR 1-like n=1 Tax=Rutidosis leptorrhynchoides TaxID=125765 RepID=UPI003A99E623